jgi:hypothetical protein
MLRPGYENEGTNHAGIAGTQPMISDCWKYDYSMVGFFAFLSFSVNIGDATSYWRSALDILHWKPED